MRVGVTGNYASGKGTVCEIFKELGAVIVDTDIVARTVVEPGMPGFIEIISRFGDEFIDEAGSLDRKKLGRFVFSEKQRVDDLNSILHPLIRQKTLELTPDMNVIYMINAPVLFEAGFNTFMDFIIVVSSEIDQSIDRGIKRDGLSKHDIENRLSHQISLNEKIKFADYIIDNSGTIENTRKQAEVIWKILKINSLKVHK